MNRAHILSTSKEHIMSNLKIAAIALVAVFGATSIASAAPRSERNANHAIHRMNTDRAPALQQGRSVYQGPSYQYQTAPQEPMTQYDGSNAPAH
jgi:hypothetical protein